MVFEGDGDKNFITFCFTYADMICEITIHMNTCDPTWATYI